MSQFLGLMAESSIPVGKAIACVLLFGPVALFATIASFASREQLLAWSDTIGTKNPTVARAACVALAVFCGTSVIVAFAAALGALD